MKIITLQEQYELFCDTIDLCGTYLLDCNDEEIEYNLLEEFDGDSISFLHSSVLDRLFAAGLITQEVARLATELRAAYRTLDGTELFTVSAVRTSKEWLHVLSLADEIKSKLNK